MSHYLVTGAAGFIGSHLVEALLERGDEVTMLDDLSTGKEENIEPFLSRARDFRADVRQLVEPSMAERVLDGVDYILHQAALGSVPRSVEDPMTTHSSNVDGTLAVLEASRAAEVKGVVVASSSSVYGLAGHKAPKNEGRLPEPLSPYAASKVAVEAYCLAYKRTYGVPVVCLRYFNVFGPRQDPGGSYAAVIPRFVTAMLRGGRPVVYGDGEQSRDFTYVSNVVEANLLAAARAERIQPRAGINIGTGVRHTVAELVATLSVLTRAPMTGFDRTDPRPGDVRHSLADIGDARALLGYEPEVGFEEGLERTVVWFEGRG